jgi:large subunit ribosomal protein L5e
MAGFTTQKSKAYFKRYQVKYKRRRQGKTDYRARLRLAIQDKNKYATPKYRFVARLSNAGVTCQVIYATMAGDKVIAAAYSRELPEYGLKVGLSNYAAAYCVGLLCARRALNKLGLADAYEGNVGDDDEHLGEDFTVEPNDDGPRPFTCFLDVGLHITSTGSKVFACMKGALDGGIDIPHNEKRLFGYDPDSKELDNDMLRGHILGEHVTDFMEQMQEDEPDQYAKQFSSYVKEGVDADDYGELLQKVHAAIRAKPVLPKKSANKPKQPKKWQAVKKTYEQRKNDMRAKLIAARDA